MNGQPRQRATNQSKGFQSRVIKALQERPEYVLIYAVILTIFSATCLLLPQSSTVVDKIVVLILVIIVIGAVVMVIRMIIGPPQPPESKVLDDSGLNLTDLRCEYRDYLYSLCDSLKGTQKYNNGIFHEIINDNLVGWKETWSHWKNGECVVLGSDYNKVLVRVYGKAEQDTFSTSVPQYLEVWTGHLGKFLLRAHKVSRVPVSRVFIFESQNDVTDDVYEKLISYCKMAKECEGKMQSYIFFERDLPQVQLFPPGQSKDVTMVDGSAAISTIAKTDFDRNNKPNAHWYFDRQPDDVTRKGIAKLKDELLKFSTPLETWIEQWDRGGGEKKSISR